MYTKIIQIRKILNGTTVLYSANFTWGAVFSSNFNIYSVDTNLLQTVLIQEHKTGGAGPESHRVQLSI